ncbi:MAG: exosortase U [Pirellula sp.]
MKTHSTFDLGLTPWTWATLVLPVLALAPLLAIQASLLMQKPHLQFFPLALLGAAYFLKPNAEPQRDVPLRRWAIYLWIGGIVLSVAALVLVSPWLAHVCFIVMVGVWALGARPNMSVLRVIGVCGLIAVTLPPPFGWDQVLVQALQAISSVVCSRLMDLTGIYHVRRGNIIEIASKPLFIEEACSGVDSQYALMAVAGVLLLLGRAGLTVSLLTIVTVPIWAILGNLLRIYLIAAGLDWFGVDLSSGTVHTMLGLCVFIFTAWVHWSSVQLLNFLQLRCFHSERSGAIAEPGGVEDVAVCTRGEVQTLPFSKIWLALPTLLFIFMPSNFQAIADFVAAPDLPAFSGDLAERFPGRNALTTNEAQIVGFQSVTRDRSDLLGQHSRIWQLRNETSRMTVSLDFPFRGWHPLWVCYMNAGWKQRSLEIVHVSDDEGIGREFAFYESLLENDLGDIAVLHFSLFDEHGQPYTLERKSQVPQAENRLQRNLWTRIRREDQVRDPITFQFQQLSQTNTSPTPQQLERLRGMYRKLRGQVYGESMPVIESLTQR